MTNFLRNNKLAHLFLNTDAMIDNSLSCTKLNVVTSVYEPVAWKQMAEVDCPKKKLNKGMTNVRVNWKKKMLEETKWQIVGHKSFNEGRISNNCVNLNLTMKKDFWCTKW